MENVRGLKIKMLEWVRKTWPWWPITSITLSDTQLQGSSTTWKWSAFLLGLYTLVCPEMPYIAMPYILFSTWVYLFLHSLWVCSVSILAVRILWQQLNAFNNDLFVRVYTNDRKSCDNDHDGSLAGVHKIICEYLRLMSKVQPRLRHV